MSIKMKYQLVLQFNKLKNGLEDLILMEDELSNIIDIGKIDGHDIGRGQMNIFILTDNPLNTFAIVKNFLEQKKFVLPNVKIAYRDIEDETYICLWPKNLTDFQVI